MSIKPELKTNTMIEEMNSIFRNGEWNFETAKYFETEAQKIRKQDIAEGDMLLDIIEGLNGNVPEMEKRFTNALAYCPNEQAIIMNYGSSLFNNALYSGAINTLLPISDSVKEAALIIGFCCEALGLEAKAKQYFDIAEYQPKKSYDFPISTRAKAGIQAVFKSFTALSY